MLRPRRRLNVWYAVDCAGGGLGRILSYSYSRPSDPALFRLAHTRMSRVHLIPLRGVHFDKFHRSYLLSFIIGDFHFHTGTTISLRKGEDVNFIAILFS